MREPATRRAVAGRHRAGQLDREVWKPAMYALYPSKASEGNKTISSALLLKTPVASGVESGEKEIQSKDFRAKDLGHSW